MGNCLMSYGVQSNALIKFDYRHITIKYANHGSTMTLNTQGTAYSGVTAQFVGQLQPSLLFMKSVLMVALICSMRRKIPITPIC